MQCMTRMQNVGNMFLIQELVFSRRNYVSKREMEACMELTHYYVKALYDKMIREQVRVTWDTTVRNRLNFPKHRFIILLVVQEKLHTTTMLARIGISNNPLCLFCADANEDHHHLFFKCHMSVVCLTDFKRWVKCYALPMIYNNSSGGFNIPGGQNFKTKVMLAGIAALAYLIWQSRNKVYWLQCVLSIRTICNHGENYC